MAEIITPFTDDASLVDLAVSLITGGVESQIAPRAESGAAGALQPTSLLKLESNILPTNGDVANRVVIQKDDNDVDLFVPTNGKAIAGNLFVARRVIAASSIGSTVEGILNSYLNDVRQILDNADARLSIQFTDAAGNVAYSGTLMCVAFGILKDTQTDDYNPLTVINAGWNYKMFDSYVVQELYNQTQE